MLTEVKAAAHISFVIMKIWFFTFSFVVVAFFWFFCWKSELTPKIRILFISKILPSGFFFSQTEQELGLLVVKHFKNCECSVTLNGRVTTIGPSWCLKTNWKLIDYTVKNEEMGLSEKCKKVREKRQTSETSTDLAEHFNSLINKYISVSGEHTFIIFWTQVCKVFTGHHFILQIMTNNINLQITFSCRPTCKLRLTGLSGTHGDSSSSSSNLFTSASILNGLSSKLTARPIFFDFFVKVFLKAFPSSCTSSSSSPPSLSFRAMIVNWKPSLHRY